jgi:protein dithiol oxidoreductase (disulfide-forming)
MLLSSVGFYAWFRVGPPLAKYTLASSCAEATNLADITIFFWYGCPHCASLMTENYQPATVRDDLIEIPVAFSESLLAHTRLYYVFQHLGVEPRLRSAIFDEIGTGRSGLITFEEQLRFANRHGVPTELFKETYKLANIDANVAMASSIWRKCSNEIQSVPSALVNKKFIVKRSYFDSPAEFWAKVDELRAAQ